MKRERFFPRRCFDLLQTFEKKKALDSIVPKLDIYVHSLTPKKLTARGLDFDGSLKTFVKEWVNTKKGRMIFPFAKAMRAESINASPIPNACSICLD